MIRSVILLEIGINNVSSDSIKLHRRSLGHPLSKFTVVNIISSVMWLFKEIFEYLHNILLLYKNSVKYMRNYD